MVKTYTFHAVFGKKEVKKDKNEEKLLVKMRECNEVYTKTMLKNYAGKAVSGSVALDCLT